MKIYNLPPPSISVYMRLIYMCNQVYISTSINIKSRIYIQFVCMCVFYTEKDKVKKRENDGWSQTFSNDGNDAVLQVSYNI